MIEFHEHAELAPALDPDARLQQIREAFVNDVLRGLVWLSLCILVLSAWRNFMAPVGSRYPQALIMIVIASGTLVSVFLFRKQLPYRTKAAALLFVLFLTGTGGMISFGQAAPTGNYFAMGFFISAMLFPRAIVFSMIGGAVILMSLVGYSVVSGLHEITVNLNAVALQPLAWLNMVMTLALSAGAIAIAVGSFTRSLHALLGDVYLQQIQIKDQRDQIRHLATHDNLTGLPILRLAADRSNVAIARARRTGEKLAYMFIDLDGFKVINDRHGHDAGDWVLKEVAQRLKTSVRSADTAARIGGDEFMIILTDLAHAHCAGEVAAKIIQAISDDITYEGAQLNVGASIGIAIFPDHADNLDELKKVADKAMYSVKASGKNTYLFATAAKVP